MGCVPSSELDRPKILEKAARALSCMQLIGKFMIVCKWFHFYLQTHFNLLSLIGSSCCYFKLGHMALSKLTQPILIMPNGFLYRWNIYLKHVSSVYPLNVLLECGQFIHQIYTFIRAGVERVWMCERVLPRPQKHLHQFLSINQKYGVQYGCCNEKL